MKHPSTWLTYVALLIGVIAFSTSAIFVKLCAAPPGIIAMYRMLFSAVLTAVPLLLYAPFRTQLRQLPFRTWLMCTLAAALLSVHYLLWFSSLHMTSVVSSTVIVTVQPLFAGAIGYVWYHERIRGWAAVGYVLVIVGALTIGVGDTVLGAGAAIGDVLALFGSLAITLFFVLGQSVRTHLYVTVYTFMVYALSAAMLCIYNVSVGNPFTGYSTSTWLWLWCLAAVPTLFGQSLFNWLLKWLNATTLSMSILGEPVGTTILAYFIFGTRMTLAQAIGSLGILMGIGLFLRFNSTLRNAPNLEAVTDVVEQT